MHAAFLSSLANLGILIGGFVGGCLAGPIGYQNWQITVAMAIGGGLLACKFLSSTFLIRTNGGNSCIDSKSKQSSPIFCVDLLFRHDDGLRRGHCPRKRHSHDNRSTRDWRCWRCCCISTHRCRGYMSSSLQCRFGEQTLNDGTCCSCTRRVGCRLA